MPEPTPTGAVTDEELRRARAALGTVPATIKAAVERGYTWLKELYNPGDSYALALVYDPVSKRYKVLKLEARTWRVIAEALL